MFFCRPNALPAVSAENDHVKSVVYNGIGFKIGSEARCQTVSRDLGGGATPEHRRQLSDADVADAKGGKDTCVWDGVLPGFGLRTRATGTKRWILRYVERGRARVLTIGDASRMKCRNAREVARKRLADLAKLGLPRKPRRAYTQAKAVTFSQLAERYLIDRPFAWKPSTEAIAARRIRLNLCEAFGDMQVAAIRKQDVMRWRDGSADRPGDCNACIAHLSGVMQYAEKLGLRPKGSNPARGVPTYRAEPKERFLAHSEYRRLHQRLAGHEDCEFVAAIRLLIHTGARRGEIINLTWGEVSKGRLELKDSKTGPKCILLSRQAGAVLESLTRGPDDSPVFPRFHGHGEKFAYEWSKLRRLAGLPDVRLHDLRHSYASIAIQHGIQLEAVGRLLGHTSAETTARYAHLTDSVVADAAEAVSTDILRLMRFDHESL